VAATRDAIWLIDDEGWAEKRRLEDGAVQHRVRVTDGIPTALAATESCVLVACPDHVSVIQAGAVVARVHVAGVVDLAVSTDGTRAAALEREGALTVWALPNLEISSRIAVGGRATGVVWSPEGHWLVATGHELRVVREDGGEVSKPSGLLLAPAGRLAISVHGVIAAVQLGPRRVGLVHVADAEPVGELSVGRDVVGITGGPRGKLWLGLRHGEVQRVDLLTGEARTAVSHANRARIPWAFEASFQHRQIAGMLARHLAGGAPLSEYIPPPEPPTMRDGWKPWQWALLVVLGFTMLAGVTYLLYRWRVF
jgi:hypothetical protein